MSDPRPAIVTEPLQCGRCGDRYWSWGAHAERCTGRPAKPKGEPTHGTESAYTHHGCRCDECREAGSTARRRRRAGDGPGKIVGQQKHGIKGYTRHGCRCDVCRAANAAAHKRYMARRREREKA